ncbi:MAG: ring,2-phenylacetyl-CoA epoxidase subunit PaaC, partial [Kribbellaceae bacterium]|nr:ring,2-phenylacetyl-CoA epoxidase subunit PaaC [Kribbellaceae bacterium]
MNDLFTYTLRLGDDALIAAQRTAEWIAAAPQLEEDVA